ncbi:MAG: SGNH/GDSL hydrolase family protein [Bryobacterales bacterium]|nr:SGNH/GDSL hydrolase family protein [Bryobacterales bacterium]
MIPPHPSRQALAVAVLAALSALVPPAAGQPEPAGADRWEAAIRAFEERDRANPPPKGGVVFLGSSSFRRWDLEKAFPGRGLINRGFGGSQMADALRHLDRIVLPLEPRTLLLYEGDNDIGRGKSPDTVESEFRELVARVRERLPATHVVFVAIKPSLRRWHVIEKVREANSRIRAVAEADALVTFVDVGTPLLGPDGKPRPDLFVEDQLHLNGAGYAIWAELLAPYVE